MARENLTTEEAKDAFLTIMKEDKQGFFYLAFLTALHTKGETADELLGLYQATAELCPVIETGLPSHKVVDIAGTGGSQRKTVNVSTAASFIGAASGLYVAKQAARRITSPAGSADVYEAFGISPYTLQPEQIAATLEKVGTVPLYYPAFAPALRTTRIELSGKIFREAGLKIRTPLHLFAFAFHPIKEVKRKIYGVMEEQYVPLLAELFQKAGYEKGMVVHSAEGYAELSPTGINTVVEHTASTMKEYTLTPADFGLPQITPESIEARTAEQNIIDFLRIIYGKEHGPKAQIVYANGGALLYLMEQTSNLVAGVSQAQALVREGYVGEKLEQLVDTIGKRELFNSWKSKADIGKLYL